MSNNVGFCMHCGTPFGEGELFCKNCGKRVLADLHTGSKIQNTGSGGGRSANAGQWNRQQPTQRQQGSVYQAQSQNASGRNNQWNTIREAHGDMGQRTGGWQAHDYPEEKKKKGGRIFLVCGILAAAAALTILCIVLFAYPKSNDPKDSPTGIWETESKKDDTKGGDDSAKQLGNAGDTKNGSSRETTDSTGEPMAPLPTAAIQQESSYGSESDYSADSDSGDANSWQTPTEKPEMIYPTVQQYVMPTDEKISIYSDDFYDNDETHRLKFVDSYASSDANKKFDDNDKGKKDNIIRKAESAIDLDIETSWQEGASGNGEGEWIVLSFESPKTVEYIDMYLGNWRVPYDGNDFYSNNCSPKKITMYADGQKYSMSFVRKKVLQRVTFEESVTAKEFRFVIEEAYAGKDQYHDCCISEIIPYGIE